MGKANTGFGGVRVIPILRQIEEFSHLLNVKLSLVELQIFL